MALSQDAGADLLIPGDKDLLTLGQFGITTILTWSEAATRFGLD